MRALDYCVQLNELLFDKTHQILLDWMDEIQNPEGNFLNDGDREYGIGWMWDDEQKKPVTLKFGNSRLADTDRLTTRLTTNQGDRSVWRHLLIPRGCIMKWKTSRPFLVLK